MVYLMKSPLDHVTISIPCKCGTKTDKTIGWIKSNTEFVCICGITIPLNSDYFTLKIADVKNMLADYKKSFQ